MTLHERLRPIGILVASAFALAVGCSAPAPERVDPRGRYPDVGRGNVDPHEAGGVLVVSTPTEADWSSGRTLTNGPEMRPPVVHTGYAVFNAEGDFVRHVPNHSLAPSADEAPEEIALPPGRYLIRPDDPRSGQGPFWVTVDPAHRTQVDIARIQTTPPPPEAR